jgi:AAHS family 4-hydroxybenzoate transporter-like MFS transporter
MSAWRSKPNQAARFLILVLCCAAMVIEGYDVQVLAYAAPAIIHDGQIEQAYFGPVFGAGAIRLPARCNPIEWGE